MSAGERLKKLRKMLLDKAYTQGEMASFLGIHRGNYGNIEKDKRPVSGAVIEVLKSKFNVNPEWLLEGTGNPFFGPRALSMEESRMGDIINECLQRFSQIQGEQLEILPRTSRRLVAVLEAFIIIFENGLHTGEITINVEDE